MMLASNIPQCRSAVAHFLRPFDGYDGSASDTAPPTSDAILEVKHLFPVPAAQPGQGFRCQQGRMRARAIDLDQIARPEILDPGRVKRDHLRARCSLFVPERSSRAGRVVNREVTLARNA